MTRKGNQSYMERRGWPRWLRFLVRLAVAVIGSIIIAFLFQKAEELISHDPIKTAQRLAQDQTEVQIATGLILHISDIVDPEVNSPPPSPFFGNLGPPPPGCADDLLHAPPTMAQPPVTALMPTPHTAVALGTPFGEKPTPTPSLGQVHAQSRSAAQGTPDLASLHLDDQAHVTATSGPEGQASNGSETTSVATTLRTMPIPGAVDHKAAQGGALIIFTQPTSAGPHIAGQAGAALPSIPPLEKTRPVRTLACAVYLNHRNPFLYPLPAGAVGSNAATIATSGRPEKDVHLRHWAKFAPVDALKPTIAFADAMWSLSTSGPGLRQTVFRVAFGLGFLSSVLFLLPASLKSGNPLKVLFSVLVLIPAATLIVAVCISLVFHWIIALGALLFGWLTCLAGLAAALGAVGTCCSVALTKALEVTAQQRVEHIGELL